MAERVVSLDLGVVWEPNAPQAVLITQDLGPTVLAVLPHREDPDRRHVVLVWSGARAASMTPPNDEGIAEHRLFGVGLDEVRRAGVVEGSELVASIEAAGAGGSRYGGLVHHVVVLKECVVEVVAGGVTVERYAGATTLVSAASVSAR